MYHRADFIQSDPVQFPHRYTLKQDIEVSGLLTAIMSFGNRKQILKKADELHGLMGDSPYQYVLEIASSVLPRCSIATKNRNQGATLTKE